MLLNTNTLKSKDKPMAEIPPIPSIGSTPTPTPTPAPQTIEAALLDPNQSINTAPEQLNAFNTSWKHRRIMSYIVLLFCAFFIGYIIIKDHADSNLHVNALWALMAMASSIVSAYIGFSVMDSKNVLASKLDFAKSQNSK